MRIVHFAKSLASIVIIPFFAMTANLLMKKLRHFLFILIKIIDYVKNLANNSLALSERYTTEMILSQSGIRGEHLRQCWVAVSYSSKRFNKITDEFMYSLRTFSQKNTVAIQIDQKILFLLGTDKFKNFSGSFWINHRISA